MKKWIYFGVGLLVIVSTVIYLTYLYRSTGVPFYRHNETYRILQSDTLSQTPNSNENKNYTQPFKKYSLIGDEEELQLNYPDTFAIEMGIPIMPTVSED